MKSTIHLMALMLGAFPLFAQTTSIREDGGKAPTSLAAFTADLKMKAPGVGPINDVWGGFQKVWEDQRAQFARTKESDQGAVVFFGNSITEYWDIAAAFPKLKTANRGIAGDTTRGMLYRLPEDVIDLHPLLIVFLGGINDLYQVAGGGTPENAASNVRSILKVIHEKLPQTPVIVCEILPSKTLETASLANAAVDQVVADFPQAHRLKLNSLYLKPDGQQNASLFIDGTHPNQAGYAVWRSALEPEIHKWLPKTANSPDTPAK